MNPSVSATSSSHTATLTQERGASMHIKVLGPVEVGNGDGALALGPNQRRLVAMLAARPGEIVPAGTLIEGLWPAESPDHPHGALQNVVSRLRSRLGPSDAGALLTEPPGYGLAIDHVTIDHRVFERALSEAHTVDTVEHAVVCYDAALRLWRGDAYAEFSDLEGVRDDAVRLDELRAVAREERLALLVRLDPSAAVAELEAMVASQPYRERGHMLLMEALYRNQRQRDALAAYQRYRSMLADELGLSPSDAIRHLESAILTDTLPVGADGVGTRAARSVDDSAPSRAVPGDARAVEGSGDGTSPADMSRGDELADGSTPTVVVGNLAERRASFVGRDREVDAVASLLVDSRLVSLVGVGGAGKTTLATEIARTLAPGFRDGAWIVDLVGLSAGGRIADHIAGVIGLGRLPTDDPVGALGAELEHRSLLLVLDNCEHLVARVAQVVDRLLAISGPLRVLATSREALRIPGEMISRVAPLGLPPPDATAAQLLESESGRLFVDRALDIDPTLQLDDEDAPIAAGICHRLDGLPLAIELAAARLPALGLQPLADRLDDRFRLLSSHHRTSVEHHQTLRAAIGWSVDLLDDQQTLLFARLGVFVGDFELEAAEHVCADERLDQASVAEALTALVERSLVVTRRDDRMVRYRLLETIRDHAGSLLGEDELEAIGGRHREWYRGFAHDVGEGFLLDSTEWYGRLRAAFPNLRSAFEWSMHRSDVAEALDLTTALHWSPFNTGHLYREIQSWVEQSLAAARATTVPRYLLGRGLVSAGSLATLESRPDEAIDLLSEAIGLFSADADRTGEMAWTHMWLAATLADADRHHEAIEAAGKGLSLAQSIDYSVAVVYLAAQHAEVCVGAAFLTGDDGCRDTARASYVLAADAASRLGAEEGLLRARHGQALLAAAEADPVAALPDCLAALDGWRRIGSGNRLILGLTATARVALIAGATDTAAALVLEALDAMDRVGWRQPLRRALEVAVLLALHRGAAEDAALLTGAARQRFATPRWYVPLETAEAKAFDSRHELNAWTDHEELGSTLTDAAAAAVARRAAAPFVEK